MLRDQLSVNLWKTEQSKTDCCCSEGETRTGNNRSRGFVLALNRKQLSLMVATFLLCLFTSVQVQAQCNNVTYPGEIVGNETSCDPFDPAPIGSQFDPSGGSGAIEYLWLASTSGCPTSLSDAIPGANSKTYDPGFITQTTWYVRCSRRVGCAWTTIGESNCIKKGVTGNCPPPGGPQSCPDVISGGTLDFSDPGQDWAVDAMSGSYSDGSQNFDITINDPDNIFVTSGEASEGLLVGMDPNDVDDGLVICYNLGEVSNHVVFKIKDLDRKVNYQAPGGSNQEEKVCVYGTLGSDTTKIMPTITSYDGNVAISGNCAVGTTSSASSGQEESVLIEFDVCIDKITIEYCTGPTAQTNNPTYSKIYIGDEYGIIAETCGLPCDTEICEEQVLDFEDPGNDWTTDATSGSYTVGDQTYDISISDPDGILVNTGESGKGILVGTDPGDTDDEVVICYNLEEVSNKVVFKIRDLDKKGSGGAGSNQQEQVCVYGTLGSDPTQIFPELIPYNGSVQIVGNCAIATTISTANNEESVLVIFDECIDKITIEYGTGPNSPVNDPTYGKIYIGDEFGFITGQCDPPCCDITVSADGGSIDCANPSTQITATSNQAGASYSWTGPGGFSSSDQNPTVSEAGTYTVIASYNGGACSDTATAEVDGDFEEPQDVHKTPGTILCGEDGVMISASSSTPGVTFYWTLMGNFVSSDQAFFATEAGVYVVVITRPDNGCSVTKFVSVDVQECGKMGDFVFYDADCDGAQDNGAGVEGVIVNLYMCGDDPLNDAPVKTDTTDPSGHYFFCDLMPEESYFIEFEKSSLPPGFVFTERDAGPNDKTDSDANEVGLTICSYLQPGEMDSTWDAGVCQDTCINVICGGEIAYNEVGCDAYDPEIIMEVGAACGQGPLEYMWLCTTDPSKPLLQWDVVPGANGPDYDPGMIQQTKYYVRCVRTVGCDVWWESNLVIKEVNDNVESYCKGVTFPYGYSVNLPGVTFPGISDQYDFIVGAKFTKMIDGTARFEGLLKNTSNPYAQWYINLYLAEKKDWLEWSGMLTTDGLENRDFRTGVGGVEANHPLWDYYIVDSTQTSYMQGFGPFDGKILTLTHAPGNYKYAFQIGDGANGQTAAFGAWGSFAFNGDYSGEGNLNVELYTCREVCPPVPRLAVRAMLEGPFNNVTNQMSNNLVVNNLLPLNQPYNVAPWNYGGSESLTLPIPSYVVDWVYVTIRDKNDPTMVIDEFAALIDQDGWLRDPDGYGFVESNLDPFLQEAYVVIDHRNHISIMSAEDLDKQNRFLHTDFVAAEANAFNDPNKPGDAVVELIPGYHVMFAGDAKPNGVTNAADVQAVLLDMFQSGAYNDNDISMNAVVNSSDVYAVILRYFNTKQHD